MRGSTGGKPFFFEATVVVNLTVMLVLVTMFISVSEGLPKTSYIKMIDVWLVFVLLIPFFEVLSFYFCYCSLSTRYSCTPSLT